MGTYWQDGPSDTTRHVPVLVLRDTIVEDKGQRLPVRSLNVPHLILSQKWGLELPLPMIAFGVLFTPWNLEPLL